MDSETILKIDRQVFKQFPYLTGTIPYISQQSGNCWLLLYKGSAAAADGHVIPIVVRVIADITGSDLKITTSR